MNPFFRNAVALLLVLGCLGATGPAQSEEEEKPAAPAVSAELRKRAFTDTVPVLGFIQSMTSLPKVDTKELTLEEVIKETKEHSPAIREARVRLEAARKDAKSPPIPNVLTLFNPVDMPNIKQAAEANADAVRYQLQSESQKAELTSAKLYAALCDTWLNRQVAFGQMEQGKRQLRAAQEHFVSGDNTRFEVTRAEMQLIARYQELLKGEADYKAASRVLAASMGRDPQKLLAPADVQGDKPPTVWQRVAANLGEEAVLKAARDNHPDLKAVQARRKAADKMGNLTNRTEAGKANNEEEVLGVTVDRARLAVDAASLKAWEEYQLAEMNRMVMAQQVQLADQLVRQTQVSQDSGFSSANDVADAQLEAAKVQAAYRRAIILSNVSQLQLFAEMGQLEKPEGK